MTYERIRCREADGATWYALMDVAQWLKIPLYEARKILADNAMRVRVLKDEAVQGHGCRKAYITADGIAQLTARLYMGPTYSDGEPGNQDATKKRYDMAGLNYLIKKAYCSPKLRETLKQLMDAADLTLQEREILEAYARKGFSGKRVSFEVHYCERNVQRIKKRAVEKILSAQEKEGQHEQDGLFDDCNA